MKRAVVAAASVTVQCPACRDLLPNPDTGSHLWDVNETWPETVTCVCETTVAVKLPKRISTQ